MFTDSVTDDTDLPFEQPLVTHGLDFTRLAKGDRITADVIERVTKTLRGTTAYEFAKLGLGVEIERALSERDQVVTLKYDHDDIRILTDEEAVYENDNRKALAIAKYKRAHEHLAGVDRGNISDKARADQDASLSRSGRILGMLDREKKKFPDSKPRERQTPNG